jgi:diaminopimelate epimerase
MSSRLPFIKATACGNDFILIDGSLVREPDRKSISERICHRNLGVGADGVEWLYPDAAADIRVRLINSDGSDAEVSGNGTRCVAAWIAQERKLSTVRVLTDAGLKTCELMSHTDSEFQFRSDMGEPKIEGEFPIQLSTGERRGLKLSVGNPQFIVFVEAFGEGWLSDAAEIEGHPMFPNRTNVEFVRVLGPHEIEIRIYERGAGETQSSGTGSCASAVAAIHTGRVQSPVRVLSPGGPQIVTWDERIWLEGPARILCEGEFYL